MKRQLISVIGEYLTVIADYKIIRLLIDSK